jgi:protoheme IX farnesyltransferase
VETIRTIALERSARSHTRLKEFWDLTKPRMNMVVVVTTVAGCYLASPGPVEWVHLVPTLLDTASAAAGASVLNQVMERDYDALMQRTANRPLPAGRIRPLETCLFGLLLAVAGVAQIVLYCLALIPVTLFPVVLGTAGWAYFAVAIVLNAIAALHPFPARHRPSPGQTRTAGVFPWQSGKIPCQCSYA